MLRQDAQQGLKVDNRQIVLTKTQLNLSRLASLLGLLLEPINVDVKE